MSLAGRRQKRCMNAIEGVLKFVCGDTSARETLDQLETRFLSPATILESNLSALGDDILDQDTAELLNAIPALARALQQVEYGANPRLDTLHGAAGYLRTLFIGVPVEQFFLLCLDDSGRLLDCVLLQSGTLDQTPFYLSHLLKNAIDLGAAALILCHNHPGGTLRPSRADITCTEEAMKALYPLGIMLLDHVIVAADEIISLRDLGYVPAASWIRQGPERALLRNWLAQ